MLPSGESDFELLNDVAVDLVIDADRDQLYRVIGNIARNAAEAGARICMSACNRVRASISTCGTSGRAGAACSGKSILAVRSGTGLSLAIAGDIDHAWTTMETGASGTCFRATACTTGSLRKSIRQPVETVGESRRANYWVQGLVIAGELMRNRNGMAAIARTQSFAGRQTIVDEGEPAESLFNITSGAVKPYKLLPDGRRQSTGFLFEGDFWEAL